MDDIAQSFEAWINGERFITPFSAQPTGVMHAAALALHACPKYFLELDWEIAVQSVGGWESGTTTIRETLEWVNTEDAHVLLNEEPADVVERLRYLYRRLGQ